jgi:hypothetical protein
MEQVLVNQVWQRASSLCEYCRMPQQHDVLTFQIDHIIWFTEGFDTKDLQEAKVLLEELNQ